ncbi:hypothetical protein GGR50DRAFT_154397 [Xylaria sp. CBS 124048]|nr:hypothetical protein GGR50DRAFT_154397 [Xylaria sp. CBS 124048]
MSQTTTPAVPPSSPSPPIPTRGAVRPPILSPRSLKQIGLFFAGAGFLSLSTWITRRAISRKALAIFPKFHTPNTHPINKVDAHASSIAFEALNLATLNVVGFAIMMAGGISWAFDISGVEDLRSMTRKHVGPTGMGTDEDLEKEVEEWVAKMLLRKTEGLQKEEEATAAAAATTTTATANSTTTSERSE